LTVKGYDQDQSFMLVEVLGDVMEFQAISRTGRIVDSGTIERQQRSSGAGRTDVPAEVAPEPQLSAPPRYNEGFGEKDPSPQ
jgi:hypothetical protein